MIRDITRNRGLSMASKEIEILAIIAAGTKRRGRVVNILRVAEALKELYQLHGSLSAVSKVAKLSPEMIREFIKITELTSEVKHLIRKGLINGIDISYRISKLPARDQVVLSRSVLRKQLTSKDVRFIVKYKIDNPKLSMSKAVQYVMESKNRKIYVAYFGIDENTYESLGNKLGRGSKRALMKSLFFGVAGKNNVVCFDLSGRVVLIKASREGLERMRNKTREAKVPFKRLADTLAREYLGGKR